MYPRAFCVIHMHTIAKIQAVKFCYFALFTALAIQTDILLQTIDFYNRSGNIEDALANGTLNVRIGNNVYSGADVNGYVEISTTSLCPEGSVEDVVVCSKLRTSCYMHKRQKHNNFMYLQVT